MVLLVLFAFVAGIVTILSPCILPILPVILSGTVGGGKRKPFGIMSGFVLSFTFFTLFLTTIVQATGISADTLRLVSVIVILVLGFALVYPKMQFMIENSMTRLSSRFAPRNTNSGFWGGVLVGLSLGLIWTPCVGPILAAVISLALTSTVTGSAVVITLAYSLGTAIPMLAITYGGRNLMNRVPWLTRNTATIQRAFGVLMMVTALAILFNIDRTFQAYILDVFPNYASYLTSFEDNETVQKFLEKL